VAVSCDIGNEPFLSVEGGELLDYLSECQLFRKDSSVYLISRSVHPCTVLYSLRSFTFQAF
jgi:hypothetical protein